MLAKFRHHYPQGSIVSELVNLDRGLYLVKVSIRVSENTLATGLAAAERVELAEDRARERAIAALALDAASLTKVEVTETKPEPVPDSKIPNSDKPISLKSLEEEKISEDYPVEDLSVAQPPDSTPTESQAIATPELQSDLSLQSSETPATENGNLFEGTFEPQSPAVPSFNLEPPQEVLGSDSEPIPSNRIEVNFEDIKHQTDIHIKRLGWTREDGVNFLKSRYGKRSRLHLKDRELLEFLEYLENQPTPK